MQMESNDAISQKIWDGSIPVSFCVFPNEVPHELPATPPPFLVSSFYLCATALF